MDHETTSPVGAIVFFVSVMLVAALAFGPEGPNVEIPNPMSNGGIENVR